MPVYRTRHDIDDPAQELEAPAVPDAVNRATADRTHLAWPTTTAAAAAAAAAELAQLAQALTALGANVSREGQDLVLPALASGPGDTVGIRVRATGRAPHALYVITAADLVPLTHAAGALAYLEPFIEAAARGCECGAEPGEPCMPNRLPDPSTTRTARPVMERRRR
ncbi:hypothetical protein OG741_00460 [Streptomyces sp. NBC_01410]|uniref:hypothetical protein n=1 Tax=Streptomyces sp. NBC_01410 TaxID=2903856 RepID=UPI00325696E3